MGQTRRGVLRRIAGAGGTAAVASATAATADADSTDGAARTRQATAGDARTQQASGGASEVPEARVLLDYGRTHLGRVELDGRTYAAYRYENPIPGADGIDVYQGGQRVTAEALAQEVISTVVWSFLLERMVEREHRLREQFDTILKETRRMETILGPPERVLGEVDRRIQQLKEIGVETPVKDVTLWDIATTKFPSLETLAASVQRTHDLVEELLRASRRANDTLPSLLSFLDGVEDPKAVRASTAKREVRPAEQSITTLHRLSTDLIQEVESLESTARELLDGIDEFDEELVRGLEREFADVVNVDIPEQLISRATSRFVDLLRTVLNELTEEVVDPVLEPVREFRDALAETQSIIGTGGTRDTEAAMLDAWRRRRDAALVADVATAGGGFLGALALVNVWREPLEET